MKDPSACSMEKLHSLAMKSSRPRKGQALSGTGDSHRDSRESIRANHSRESFAIEAPIFGGAPNERRRGRAGETVVQKGVFGESVSSLPP